LDFAHVNQYLLFWRLVTL